MDDLKEILLDALMGLKDESRKFDKRKDELGLDASFDREQAELKELYPHLNSMLTYLEKQMGDRMAEMFELNLVCLRAMPASYRAMAAKKLKAYWQHIATELEECAKQAIEEKPNEQTKNTAK